MLDLNAPASCLANVGVSTFAYATFALNKYLLISWPYVSIV